MKTDIFDSLFDSYPALKQTEGEIVSIYNVLREGFGRGATLFVCGNGGSAADAEHIVGELMKSFKIKRPIPDELYKRIASCAPEGGEVASNLECALKAVSLGGDRALSTAFINDVNADDAYAQQLFGLSRSGDMLMCISTSGNAKNCINAAVVAKALGLKVVALTGKTGGRLAQLCDVAVIAPGDETYRIQEYHLPIYHALCAALEQEFFGR